MRGSGKPARWCGEKSSSGRVEILNHQEMERGQPGWNLEEREVSGVGRVGTWALPELGGCWGLVEGPCPGLLENSWV